MKTETKLAKLRAKAEGPVDIKDLVDINDVKVDQDAPVEERIKDFIKQIKNPYVYKCGDRVVRVKFKGEAPLEVCLGHALSNVY